MGIDPGLRRVGLAVSDEESELASPHRTLEPKDVPDLVRMLASEARALDIGEIVLGLPLRLNGTEGPEAKRARQLARLLERELSLPVVMWDERLTTVAAERQLRGVGMKGDKKKRAIDQAAATLLLQSYLDSRGRTA